MAEIQDDGRWKVKREVSLGDIIAIVIALTAVISSYMYMNARVLVIETVTQTNTMQITNTINEIKIELRRMADKMDRLVENGR